MAIRAEGEIPLGFTVLVEALVIIKRKVSRWRLAKFLRTLRGAPLSMLESGGSRHRLNSDQPFGLGEGTCQPALPQASQESGERASGAVCTKDVGSTIAARHHVVEGARVLNA